MLWTLSDFYSPIMQAHKEMCKLFTARPRSASSSGCQRGCWESGGRKFGQRYVFICPYLFPLPSHSVNTRRKI